MNTLGRRDFLLGAAGGLAGIALLPADLAALDPKLPEELEVRLGVVGCGARGKRILEELAAIDGARVVAVCDRDPGRLKAGLRRAAGASGHPDFADMLEAASQLDAVVIATSTDMHRALAETALAAGLHVYCEAPLATTIPDSQALVRAASSSDRVFAAGFTARANPLYQRAREVILSGGTGHTLSLRGQWQHKTSWRAVAPTPERERALDWKLDPARSNGLPGEVAVHHLDLAMWLLGRQPVAVRGQGGVRAFPDGRSLADTVHLDYRFEDGLLYTFDATLGSSYQGEHLILHGLDGSVRLAGTHAWLFKESDAPTLGFEVYAHRDQFFGEEGIVLLANATKLAAQGKLEAGAGLPHPPVHYALVDFLDAIAGGHAPACSGAAALPATVLGILAQRAIETDSEVTVDPALASGVDAAHRSARILVHVASHGYEHRVARPAPDGGPSLVETAWLEFAQADPSLEVQIQREPPTTLEGFDAIFFYTTGELPWSAEQRRMLLDFVRGGGGLIAAHCAADTWYQWPAWGAMLGGVFAGHPWNQEVRVLVEDPQHPACAGLDPSFRITDEIYQFRDWSRDRVHVLLRLDPDSVELDLPEVHRKDRDFALAWTRREGKGRVFYTALGHSAAVWADPRFRALLRNGSLWAASRS